MWWSDDGGRSYSMAPDFDCELPKPALNGGCGEREIVELRNSSLLAIIRSDRGGRKVSALSHDSGVTWVNQRQTTMQEPSCEGSLMQLDDAAGTLLFAGPANARPSDPKLKMGRFDATLWQSTNGGTDWDEGNLLWRNSTWYSGLAVTLPSPRRLLLCYSSGPGPPDSGSELNAIHCSRFAVPPPRPAALKTDDQGARLAVLWKALNED